VHPEYEIVPPALDAHGAEIPRLGYTGDFEYEERSDLGEWVKVTEEVKGEAKYAWHTTPKGRVGKHKTWDGYRGPDYVIRVNLFRRRFPARVFREIRMGNA